MAKQPPKKEKKRGLPGVLEARENRQAGKYSRLSTPVILTGFVGLVLSLVIWKVFSGKDLNTDKTALLAKQHAVERSIGPKWYPLRDKIERFTMGAAGPWVGDKVDPVATTWDFRSVPGIYLRLRIEDAASPEAIRKAAVDSLKDAFTGCLLKTPNPALAAGLPDASIAPDQPWNLRQAYASTRVLSPEWVNEIHESGDPLRLKVYKEQFDKADREEIPLAIDIITRAQFFLLVLDEPSDDERAHPDGGPSTPETLQLVPHNARVEIMDLKTETEAVRLRRFAQATFRMATDHTVTDDDTLLAMQRQVNNCALAQSVLSAIADAKK